MDEKKKKEILIWPVLRVYLKAALRYPWALTILLLGIVTAQLANVLAPLYLKRFIDTLATSAASAEILQVLLTTLAVYAGLAAINWIARRVSSFACGRVEIGAMADLANAGLSYLFSHSYDFFISSFSGALTRRVSRFSRAFEQVLDSFIESFIPTFLYAVGSITVLYFRNHLLGIALFTWTVIFIVVQLVLMRWRQPFRVARAAEDSKVVASLGDVITNHSVVTLFAAEAYERKGFAAVVDGWRKATQRSWQSDYFVDSVQQALSIAIEIGLLGGGAFLWSRGIITVGDFVLIQFYVIGLVERVWTIGGTIRRLYESVADASEMVEIMELQPEIQDAPNATNLQLQEGRISFQKVSFWFDKERPILTDYNLEIAGGEKIALVGPSGAGKSTITKLLLRLYDPQNGSVSIDGQDIRKVTQESLRRAISYVPQDPVLFHRTLRDNIRYGKPEATNEEIIEAAKKAHCHEFISALPQGYNTYVGERGIKLSGGERQRVAIARAILKNAPILVLDEATSSLDSESEALIQDALAKLMAGKTVVVIAHRLSTIMKMDRIVVMEGGKVILSGSHDELLAQESNLYKKLWEIQAGGFIQADA